MTQEEKAKAYDEAIKYARYLINKRCKEGTDGSFHRADLQKMFPELQENNDERIRKAIICGMNVLKNNQKETFAAIPIDDCIAWLEKQGKQKPADKIEPKFKVGDFIKHNKVNIIGKVISVNSNSYYVENIETSYRTELFNVEQKFHLWTIEDAKDGDILTCKNKTFIAKTNINYYCCCDGEQFQTNSLDSLSIDEVKGIKPATKEQCDLLFQKMVEAGYMWDAKNKELLKI